MQVVGFLMKKNYDKLNGMNNIKIGKEYCELVSEYLVWDTEVQGSLVIKS